MPQDTTTNKVTNPNTRGGEPSKRDEPQDLREAESPTAKPLTPLDEETLLLDYEDPDLEEDQNKENETPLDGTPTQPVTVAAPMRTSNSRTVSVPLPSLKHLLTRISGVEQTQQRVSEEQRGREEQILATLETLMKVLSEHDHKLSELTGLYRTLEKDGTTEAHKLEIQHRDLLGSHEKTRKLVEDSSAEIRDYITESTSALMQEVEQKCTSVLGEIKTNLGCSHWPPEEEVPTVKIECVFCDNEHSYEHCRVVKTPAERRAVLQKKSLCPMCFEQKHGADSCPLEQELCSHCANPGHNQVLCGRADLDAQVESDSSCQIIDKGARRHNRGRGARGQKRSAPTDEDNANLTELGTRKWGLKPQGETAAKQKPAPVASPSTKSKSTGSSSSSSSKRR